MNRPQLERLSQEDLDDLVMDCKLREASGINNQGRDAQIDYLEKEQA